MILFFGPPGSGKSVQGKLLVERNEWRWISTGELFRASTDPEVIQVLASGGLINDDLTNKVLGDALKNMDDSYKVVLDGYPRNQYQAEWLAAQLPEFGRKVDCVVLFKVPKEELVSRLVGRGRAEDTKEVVERRLDIYEETTRPTINYYAQHDIPVLEVDGVGDIQEIHERIQAAVSACLKLK